MEFQILWQLGAIWKKQVLPSACQSISTHDRSVMWPKRANVVCYRTTLVHSRIHCCFSLSGWSHFLNTKGTQPSPQPPSIVSPSTFWHSKQQAVESASLTHLLYVSLPKQLVKTNIKLSVRLGLGQGIKHTHVHASSSQINKHIVTSSRVLSRTPKPLVLITRNASGEKELFLLFLFFSFQHAWSDSRFGAEPNRIYVPLSHTLLWAGLCLG